MIVRCGVDIIYLPRIKHLFSKHGRKLLDKLLAPEERERVIALKSTEAQIRTFAGLFASKEAIAKALGTGLWSAGVAWRDIVILKTKQGKPYVEFRNKVKEHAEAVKIISMDISISHDQQYAVACCQMFVNEDITAFER